jgi:putative restriction endonuclease
MGPAISSTRTCKKCRPGTSCSRTADTRIKAIGIVTAGSQTGPKPDFGSVGTNWSREGWYVAVDYITLQNQIRPKEHIAILRPFLPARYSPLRESGDGLQSVYLADVPASLADALIGLIGQAYFDAYAEVVAATTESTLAEKEDEIVDRGILGPTFRSQLVKARRGQGVFRSNVLLREDHCRVTKVDQPRHLKASHIKPWREATDAERLDGANGLLLSPHIDHLFDEGLITFSVSQELIIAPEVRSTLLDAWGIDAGVRVGDFSREQGEYLTYHRANVFKGAT